MIERELVEIRGRPHTLRAPCATGVEVSCASSPTAVRAWPSVGDEDRAVRAALASSARLPIARRRRRSLPAQCRARSDAALARGGADWSELSRAHPAVHAGSSPQAMTRIERLLRPQHRGRAPQQLKPVWTKSRSERPRRDRERHRARGTRRPAPRNQQRCAALRPAPRSARPAAGQGGSFARLALRHSRCADDEGHGEAAHGRVGVRGRTRRRSANLRVGA